MFRPLVLVAFGVLFPAAQAFERACTAPTASETAACEQQRADRVLSALSARYANVWAQLAPERRTAFATAERRWLNGGRWDDHAACVAAGAADAASEVLATRCLADVTAAHLEALNTALAVRVTHPQN